jgi:hypothetical protein
VTKAPYPCIRCPDLTGPVGPGNPVQLPLGLPRALLAGSLRASIRNMQLADEGEAAMAKAPERVRYLHASRYVSAIFLRNGRGYGGA